MVKNHSNDSKRNNKSSSSTTSCDNNNNIDPSFRSEFSRAIAQALLESEEKAKQRQRQRSATPLRGGVQVRPHVDQNTDDDDESDLILQTTFEQLHFDDPTGLSSRGCRLLSQALLNTNTTTSAKRDNCYALSDRFLNSLQQALEKYQQHNNHSQDRHEGSGVVDAENPHDGNHDSEDPQLHPQPQPQPQPQLLESEDESPDDFASALSLLAWTVYGRLPLKILTTLPSSTATATTVTGATSTSSTTTAIFTTASRILGSFRGLPDKWDDPHHHSLLSALDSPLGAKQQQDEKVKAVVAAFHGGNGDDDDDKSRDKVPASTLGNGHAIVPAPAPENDADLAEVWAEESDPSDFSYGDHDDDDDDEKVRDRDLDVATFLDSSLSLTEPAPKSLTPREIALAVASLVSELAYHKVAAMPWTNQILEELTQLALILLLPSQNNSNTTTNNNGFNQRTILAEFPDHFWQQLALRPIHVLRDAATFVGAGSNNNNKIHASPSTSLSSSSSSVSGNNCLQAYLQLLKAMLQLYRVVGVVEKCSPPSTLTNHAYQKGSSSTIPPATWIGLSLLSALCTSACHDHNQQQPQQQQLSSSGNTKKYLLQQHQYQQLNQLKACLMESIDDLVSILEIIMVAPTTCSSSSTGTGTANTSSNTTTTTTSTDQHEDDGDDALLLIPSLFASMLHVLALGSPPPSSTTTTTGRDINCHSNNTQSFQLLLNSGFFRQWLLLWQRQEQHQSHHKQGDNNNNNNNNSSSNDTRIDRPVIMPSVEQKREQQYRTQTRILETALLDLCLASPKLLGKYAWRFPGFAAAVAGRRPEGTPIDPSFHGTSYALEWNLLGMELVALSSDQPGLTAKTPTIQFKKKMASTTTSSTLIMSPSPPSFIECQAASHALWQHTCQCLVEIVSQWKTLRLRESAGGEEQTSAPERQQQQQQHQQLILKEFGEFVDRLVRWPILSKLLMKLEDQQTKGADAPSTRIRECLMPLQRVLTTWQKSDTKCQTSTDQPLVSANKTKYKVDDDDDDHNVSSVPAERTSLPCSPSSSSHNPNTTSSSFLLKQSAQDAAIDSLRRSLKTLLSILDTDSNNSSNGSSAVGGYGGTMAAPSKFSSKAD